jgi:hypothetical protein
MPELKMCPSIGSSSAERGSADRRRGRDPTPGAIRPDGCDLILSNRRRFLVEKKAHAERMKLRQII